MDLTSNVWYAINERIGRNKTTISFGIYGKSCAGKQSFAKALARRIDGEGWHRVFIPIDVYLKVNRENRLAILKKGFSEHGLAEEYDMAQLEAYKIDGEALKEDINKIKIREGVSRGGVYDANSGKHTGILAISVSRWTNTVVIVDGTFVADHRKNFDIMIRVEAPYEVRKKRYQEKVSKATYSVPEWNFDGLERIAEKSIYNNWEIGDIVVRGEDNVFQLE